MEKTFTKNDLEVLYIWHCKICVGIVAEFDLFVLVASCQDIGNPDLLPGFLHHVLVSLINYGIEHKRAFPN